MLWFKHLVNARNNEFLKEIKSEFGWSGIGRWWAIVEVVAEQMDNASNKCDLEISIKDWADLLGMRGINAIQFLNSLVSLKNSKVIMKISDIDSSEISFDDLMDSWKLRLADRIATKALVKIQIPKLLRLRDSRNARREDGPAPNSEKSDTKGRRVKMPKEVIEAWEAGRLPEQKWEDYARRKGVTVELFPIFEAFCTHHKKKGSVWVDWYAAFQKWIQNAEKWNPEFFKREAPAPESAEGMNKFQKIKLATDDFMTWLKSKKHEKNYIVLEWNRYKDYINKIEYGAWIDLNRVLEIAEKEGKLIND
jgi:hypothetical protein